MHACNTTCYCYHFTLTTIYLHVNDNHCCLQTCDPALTALLQLLNSYWTVRQNVFEKL